MDDIGDVDESLLIEHCILFSSVKLMDDIGDVDESTNTFSSCLLLMLYYES
jgi:hypothetical protein